MRNRYVFAIDVLFFAAAAVGAFALRFNMDFLQQREEFWFFLVAALAIKLPIFYACGLYHRYWRYANAADVARVVGASTAGSVTLSILMVAALAVGTVEYLSRAVLAIDWLLTIVAAGGIRLSIRLEQDARSRTAKTSQQKHRLLVVGAGNVGTMVARLVEQHPDLPSKIVGFLDDDPAKQHKVVYGHPVLGTRADLERIVASQIADEVVIAMPTAPRVVIDEICAECNRLGIPKRVIPSVGNLLNGTLSVDDLREWRALRLPLQTVGPDRREETFNRVLVTGGAGFIGANFVRYWLNMYPTSVVVVLDKLTYAGNPDNLDGLSAHYPHRFVFVQGDICDRECVQRCIDQHGIEAVVNFAAESHVDRSLYFPEVFLQTNVLGTYTLLDVIRSRPSVRRFHQVSTDEVYGQALRGSFSEQDPLDTRSPYSATKAGADLLVIAFAHSFGVSATITRGSNNIGPFQYPEKVVPLFVTSAIDNQPLPVYGDGRYVRDYQYVLDHCLGIDLVMRRGAPGEIYNLGGGNEVETLDLARMILKKLGRSESLIRLVADRRGHDRRYSLNCSKVKTLGWNPRFTLEEGLDRTIEWYIDNEAWWRKVKSGDYQDYYDRQLRWRLEAAVAETLRQGHPGEAGATRE
jgi:dTDP-glucose 4,6-dehydratase